MRIQHNIAALNSHRQLTNNNNSVSKNLEKLSSGYRINRAGDDAAGLAISEKMRAQITGLDTASKNAQDGISLAQTAEGALTEVHSMLNRMVELTNQASNGTYDNQTDRANLQKELDSLKSEIDRIADSTNFNGIKLLDGSLGQKTSTALANTNGSLNLSDGITINAPVDGAGIKQSYEFDVDFGKEGALLGAGDEVKLSFQTGTNPPVDITLTGISGADKDAQMQEIVTKLNADTTLLDGTNKFSDLYTAKIGTTGKIEVTANAEGTAATTLTGVSVTDKQVALSNKTTVAAKNSTGGVANTTGGVEGLVTDITNPGDSNNISKDDKLIFTFEVNGKAQTVTLTATDNAAPKDGEFKIGATLKDTTDNIKKALEDAKFDDKNTTGADESNVSVSDFFTVVANRKVDGTGAEQGSLQIINKTANTTDVFKEANIARSTTDSDGITTNGTPTKIGTEKTATGGTAITAPGVAAEYTLEISNTFAAGETLTINGKMTDGNDFSITLTATADPAGGKNTFQIGSSLENTRDNILAALEASTTDVNVTDPVNGRAKTPTTADKIFNNTAGEEFTVAKGTGAGNEGKLIITSGRLASTGAASIANAGARPNKVIVSEGFKHLATGKSQSVASNSLTFDPAKVEQGTTFSIDGKTFEFVTDLKNVTTKGATAITIANLGERGADGKLTATAAKAEDIAKAVVKALDNTASTDAAGVTTGSYEASGDALKGKKYDISSQNGTLSITSQATGTLAEAFKDISVVTDKRSTAVIGFNTTTTGTGANEKQSLNVKAGDSVTINGKVYEFTQTGKRTSNQDYEGISLDFESGTLTANQVATALADAVKAADGNLVATVNQKDGTVSIASKHNQYAADGEDPYSAPKVELPKTGNGLRLQVGDTNEDFQKVTVRVDSMNTKALGISTLDISDQDKAAESIDKIKAAINTVSSTRGDLGAIQNRLEHTINNLGVTSENMTAAESRIRDVDMAKEMMEFTKNNILAQASQSMLAQANQLPQGVLQLLQ